MDENVSVNKKGKKKRKAEEFPNKPEERKPGIIKRENKNMSLPNERKKFCGQKSSYECSLPTKEEKRKSIKSDVSQQKITYFEKFIENLENCSPQDKALGFLNALEHSQGFEVELCCHPGASHSIEVLLLFCKEPFAWKQFMTAFSKQKEMVCINPNASHITELLIHFVIQNIQNWSSVLEVEEDSKEKEQMSFFLSWITEFGDFLTDNFIHFLGNRYASHVACTIIRALGGDMSDSTEFRSKNSKNHKKDFSSEFIDQDEVFSLPSVTLEEIPKWFKEKLKQISRGVRKMKNIFDCVTESSSATVFEALSFVLEKRLPKQSAKFIREFSSQLFHEKNYKGVPSVFLNRNSSYLVEKIFQVANETCQEFLWNEYFTNSVEFLISHQIGNYIIQRSFDVVKGNTLLQVMCEKIKDMFDEILESRHYGIFISISAACNRLKSQQALFMKAIMQCLQCSEPEERQLKLVPLLLNFKKFDDYNSQIQVCLQGSLLVQNLLAFQKPIKLVKSMLGMKPEEIAYLACHMQGCHVLTSFFKSITVGEKNKDKLIQCFQPVMITLACDQSASLTLSRIWVTLSLKQKASVADVLARNAEAIKSTKTGNVIFHKFGIFQYKHKYEKWKDYCLHL